MVVPEFEDPLSPPKFVTWEYHFSWGDVPCLAVFSMWAWNNNVASYEPFLTDQRVIETFVSGYPSALRGYFGNLTGGIVSNHVKANPILFAVVRRSGPSDFDRGAILEH